MKYSRYKLGDRVELVDVNFLKTENGEIVDFINAGILKKTFVSILRGSKEYRHLEWDAVEINYVLVEVTKIRSITATTPIVEGTVIRSSGRVSEEIVPGDKMYIHEDLRDFVTDAVVSRYIWSNYIIDPNKPDIDYAVWCLSDYVYLEKMFKDRQLSGIMKARETKRLIRDEMTLKRSGYEISAGFGHETRQYRKSLDEMLNAIGKDVRVLTFSYVLREYDDFIEKIISRTSLLFGTPMKVLCRITITDSRDVGEAIPIVSYAVIVAMKNTDYMSRSRGLTPKRNEFFRAINNEIGYYLNKSAYSTHRHPQTSRTRFFIENMETYHIEDSVQYNSAISPLMNFLFV